ncbi:uncharacterized protein LOC127246982 [Andrographis paniculata]|uniref:uncharacterized protein LOC127246982 n=1 Tax=Andrographis paniculata TaxID=175694 RepID=UPI0021E81F5B|nr:uncharacterized protein LOC127246982 [Andrographis paniculata]
MEGFGHRYFYYYLSLGDEPDSGARSCFPAASGRHYLRLRCRYSYGVYFAVGYLLTRPFGGWPLPSLFCSGGSRRGRPICHRHSTSHPRKPPPTPARRRKPPPAAALVPRNDVTGELAAAAFSGPAPLTIVVAILHNPVPTQPPPEIAAAPSAATALCGDNFQAPGIYQPPALDRRLATVTELAGLRCPRIHPSSPEYAAGSAPDGWPPAPSPPRSASPAVGPPFLTTDRVPLAGKP